MSGGRIRRQLANAILISVLTGTAAQAQGNRAGWPPALAAAVAPPPSRSLPVIVEPHPAIEAELFLGAGASDADARLSDTATRALTMLTGWFGPFPDTTLAIVDLPWAVDLAGAAYPGVVTTRTRWLAPARELTAERTLIAGLARRYWQVPATPAEFNWFAEGVSLYSSTRAIHELLEGRNYASQRAFGGFVLHVIRALNWSPNSWQPQPRVRHFAEVDEPSRAPWRLASAEADSQAQRAALALHTLERYVGWPALQPALASLRERAGERGVVPALLAEVLSEQRGIELGWFFEDVLHGKRAIDYGIEVFTSEPGGADGRFRTVVKVRRYGDGVFAGTSRPRDGSLSSSKSLALLVRFADGAQIDDFWDGRDDRAEFSYSSRSRAISATIDPGLILLVDVDRANNSRTLEWAPRPEGFRMTLNWLAWLQDLMLSYSALV